MKDSLTKQIYSFGLGKHRVTKDNVKYLECETEKELLEKFHELFRVLKPDVVTGWNVKFFDMAYLIRRMENLFGKPFTRKLSPFNFIKEKNIKVHNREQLAFIVFGVATLDYMDLYKLCECPEHLRGYSLSISLKIIQQFFVKSISFFLLGLVNF